jgi:YD repeat-containing protein
MKTQISAENTKGQIILYKNKLEVRLDEETVWIDAHAIARVFDVDRTVIVKHIGNIYKTGELTEKATCAKIAQVAADGKTRQMNIYNLDVILSVGYRVNSKQATQFRIWATNILRKHLVDGYTVNEKRLKAQQSKIWELQDAVRLLSNIALLEGVSDEARGIVQIISEYSRALNILDDYDHQRLVAPKGTRKTKYKLTYDEAGKIIEQIPLSNIKEDNNKPDRLIQKNYLII